MTAIPMNNTIKNIIYQEMAKLDSLIADAASKESTAYWENMSVYNTEKRAAQAGFDRALNRAKGGGIDMAYSLNLTVINEQYQKLLRAKDEIEKLKSTKEQLSSKIHSYKSRANTFKKQNKSEAEIQNLITLSKKEEEKEKEVDEKLSMITKIVDKAEKAFDTIGEKIEEALFEPEVEKEKVEKTADPETAAYLMGGISFTAAKMDKSTVAKELTMAIDESHASIRAQSERVHNTIAESQKSETEGQTKKEKPSFFQKISMIKNTLQQRGVELSKEHIMDLRQVNLQNSSSKVVIAKGLADVYDEMSAILGDEHVVIDRREGDRRKAAPVQPQKIDTEQRQTKSDRRSSANAIFIGL